MSYHFDGNGCSYAICSLLHPAVWLEQGKLKQLVLVVTEADTKEVLERWTFDIDTNRDVVEGRGYVNVTQKPLWKGIGCCLDYRVSFCASVPRAAENVDSKCLLVACYPTPCSKINTVSHVCTQIIHPVSIFNESWFENALLLTEGHSQISQTRRSPKKFKPSCVRFVSKWAASMFLWRSICLCIEDNGMTGTMSIVGWWSKHWKWEITTERGTSLRIIRTSLGIGKDWVIIQISRGKL